MHCYAKQKVVISDAKLQMKRLKIRKRMEMPERKKYGPLASLAFL